MRTESSTDATTLVPFRGWLRPGGEARWEPGFPSRGEASAAAMRARFERLTGKLAPEVERAEPDQDAPNPVFKLVTERGEALMDVIVFAIPVCKEFEFAGLDLQMPIRRWRIRTLFELPEDIGGIVLEAFGRTVLEVAVPAQAPRLDAGLEELGGEVSGQHKVGWSVEHPDGAEIRSKVYLADAEGRLVRPVTMSSKGSSAVVDFDALPGGRYRLGVAATDGFHRVDELSEVITIASKGRRALISGATEVSSGGHVILGGQLVDLDGGPSTREGMVWTSSLQGQIGEGPLLDVQLDRGQHVITLGAREGATIEDAVTVTVGGG